MWLFASETQSMPAFLSPLMYAGLAENTVPLPWNRNASGAGFSKLAMATSAPRIRSRIAPLSPVRRVYGRSQPNGEQSAQIPVMSAVPPSNGKLTPFALIASATPRSRRMSPPATIVHAVAGSYAGTAPSDTDSRARSGHASSVATRSTPNSDVPPHASARTDSSTSSARRNASAVRCFGRYARRATASSTVTSAVPMSPRSRPSAARIASASRSTSTSDVYVPLPPSIARISDALTVVRPDRKLVTGTMATSASVCGAAGDALAPADAVGNGVAALVSPSDDDGVAAAAEPPVDDEAA